MHFHGLLAHIWSNLTWSNLLIISFSSIMAIHLYLNGLPHIYALMTNLQCLFDMYWSNFVSWNYSWWKEQVCNRCLVKLTLHYLLIMQFIPKCHLLLNLQESRKYSGLDFRAILRLLCIIRTSKGSSYPPIQKSVYKSQNVQCN